MLSKDQGKRDYWNSWSLQTKNGRQWWKFELPAVLKDIVKSEKDLMKDPYIFEFLGIPENKQYSENDLETAIINNLQSFLLELGKGFAFIGRQQRITLNNKHYYVDLVFYHVKLKCYVLIDLK